MYDSIFDNQVKSLEEQMQEEHERMIEEMLGKWKISKEYVRQHPDEFHVEDDGVKQVYYHNDTALFRVVKYCSWGEAYEMPPFKNMYSDSDI